MGIPTVGLITYHFPHLKTEQVMQRLLQKEFKYKMYALPFKPRKKRHPLFQHRPEQSDAIAPHILAHRHSIPYLQCSDDGDIDDSCDIYLVLGAGILSPGCVLGKKIINCHPGIIPACRGLDSFKWAILDMKPLGITLHHIDAQVDSGEIISVIPTNVYLTDQLTSLARRHYESEIDCLSRFDEFLAHPINSFRDIDPGEPRMRMPLEKERELTEKAFLYIEQYGKTPCHTMSFP